MNKYKMITICSLSIVCILILSLLLPLTTSANDKESIELKMHYENSKVTVNIAINSEVYTGVVCKYIEVDNILTYDNLSEQTQQTGTTLNLNKTENDNYNTIIENVSKRYVVIYVSIGNCDICDYIDCNLNNSEESNNNNSENDNQESEDKNTNNQTSEIEENKKTDNTNEDTQNKNNETESTEEITKIENKNNNENNNQDNTNNNNNDNINQPENNEIVVENKDNTEETKEFETIEEEPTTSKSETNTQTTTIPEKEKNEENKNNEKTNKENTEKKDTNKDNIDTAEFEEIKSVDKISSTADEKMPQTGENDSIKVVGIIICSIVSVLSFYKYKKTK